MLRGDDHAESTCRSPTVFYRGKAHVAVRHADAVSGQAPPVPALSEATFSPAAPQHCLSSQQSAVMRHMVNGKVALLISPSKSAVTRPTVNDKVTLSPTKAKEL